MQQAIVRPPTVVITRDSVLAWTTSDSGRSWTMKYQGCVAPITGRSDPRFIVQARLDRTPPIYSWVGSAPAERDSLVITVRATMPAFVTVFERTEDDSVTILYPSAAFAQPSGRLIARDEELRVPPEGARLRVKLSPGARSSRSAIVAIATKRDVPLPAGSSPTGDRGFVRLSWRAYADWLNRIPQDQKAVVEIPFLIRKRD
jgi:hypothetical protein